MDERTPANASDRPGRSQRATDGGSDRGYRKPTIEVISLSCEISAYAPDEGDSPLF